MTTLQTFPFQRKGQIPFQPHQARSTQAPLALLTSPPCFSSRGLQASAPSPEHPWPSASTWPAPAPRLLPDPIQHSTRAMRDTQCSLRGHPLSVTCHPCVTRLSGLTPASERRSAPPPAFIFSPKHVLLLRILCVLRVQLAVVSLPGREVPGQKVLFGSSLTTSPQTKTRGHLAGCGLNRVSRSHVGL